jgi:hypothetical protein
LKDEELALLKVVQAEGAVTKLNLMREMRWRARRGKAPEVSRGTLTRAFNRLVADKQLVPAGKTYGVHRFQQLYSLGPRAAVKASPANLPLPLERCLFPTARRDASKAARAALGRRFEVVAKDQQSLTFRWRHTRTSAGPDFRLEAMDLATLDRYLGAARKRKLARSMPKRVGCLAIAFEDLDVVLDEMNGLIEAQAVIMKVTRGPAFLPWNGEFVDAESDPAGAQRGAL